MVDLAVTFPFAVLLILPTVGVKLLPSRAFRELSWTCPPVYEIAFKENFSWVDQTADGGSNLTHTVIFFFELM